MNNASCPAHDVGVVAALPDEAAAWARTRRAAGGIVQVGRWHVIRAGIGAEHAATAAQRLLDDGVAALLSWGMAGGLDPVLRPGDLVVCERLASVRDAMAIDAHLRNTLLHALDAAGMRVSTGVLWCHARAVTSVRDKRQLAIMHAAGIVDMESVAVARVADSAGVPFAAIKAICDPAQRALPEDVVRFVNQDGALHVAGLLAALSRGPGVWRPLWQMHRDYRAACRSLQRAAEALSTA